jgi:hypothetical protein
MKKRLMVGLLAGGLMTAMLPGVASAYGAQEVDTGGSRCESPSPSATILMERPEPAVGPDSFYLGTGLGLPAGNPDACRRPS